MIKNGIIKTLGIASLAFLFQNSSIVALGDVIEKQDEQKENTSAKKSRKEEELMRFLKERKIITRAIQQYIKTNPDPKISLDWNQGYQIYPELFPFLPKKMRKFEPKGPFGGTWFVRTGLWSELLPDQRLKYNESTIYIGLNLSESEITASQLIKELENASLNKNNSTFKNSESEKYVFCPLSEEGVPVKKEKIVSKEKELLRFMKERQAIVYAIKEYIKTNPNAKISTDWKYYDFQEGYVIYPEIFPFLPKKMRKIHPKGPFGGTWFMKMGGSNQFAPWKHYDESTIYVGLNLRKGKIKPFELTKELENSGLEPHGSSFCAGETPNVYYALSTEGIEIEIKKAAEEIFKKFEEMKNVLESKKAEFEAKKSGLDENEIKKTEFAFKYMEGRNELIKAVVKYRIESDGQDITEFAENAEISQKLHKYLPESLVQESLKHLNEGGWLWFVRGGGASKYWPSRTEDKSTAHIGLLIDTNIMTSTELVQRLKDLGLIEQYGNTFSDGREEYIFHTL